MFRLGDYVVVKPLVGEYDHLGIKFDDPTIVLVATPQIICLPCADRSRYGTVLAAGYNSWRSVYNFISDIRPYLNKKVFWCDPNKFMLATKIRIILPDGNEYMDYVNPELDYVFMAKPINKKVIVSEISNDKQTAWVELV